MNGDLSRLVKMFTQAIFGKPSSNERDQDFEDQLSGRDSPCLCTLRFHKLLRESFYKLGHVIALKPLFFLVVPVFIALIGITGVQQMTYETNTEKLFTPTNGEGRKERSIIENLFPVNDSANFDFFRQTSLPAVGHVIITAKDNGTLLRVNVFEDVVRLDETVQNISIDWDDATYTYSDLCAKLKGKCPENLVLNLREFMTEIENGSMLINYPIMLYPFSLPYYYGGVTVNESEGVLLEAKAVSLIYFLQGTSEKQKKRSLAFEKKFLEVLHNVKFESIKVFTVSSKSVDDELERNVFSRMPSFFASCILMTTFIVGSLAMSDWVRSKINIGLLGMLSAGLATGGSSGFLMYLGVPFVGINMAIPFLMLGIGIDDMFVVLSAWHRTNIQDPVPIRLAKTYSDAAISITITSLTDMLSFFIGILTPFMAVRIFCLYTGFAVLATYLMFITFFGGCLAKVGYLEKKGRHCVTLSAVLPKSKAETKSCCYKFWCTGGIDDENPWNPKDNKVHVVNVFFRDYLGEALNYSAVKALVICLFAVYLSGAIYGCTQIEEGMQISKLALDDSYVGEFFDKSERLFKMYPYRYQVVINEKLTYSDPDTQQTILDLHEAFENLTFVAPRMFTQSGIRGFYKFLDKNPDLKENITDEKSFIKILKSKYLAYPKMNPEDLDIAFNEDESEIIASRFIIQAYNITGSTEGVTAMLELRRVAKESKFNVVVYNFLFLTFDQFVSMRYTCIQTISLAAILMMIVSLIFIPNPLCSIWIAFSIISIEIGVLGYMALWKVNLDSISVVNLILCVGFSVDFSAHISYAYLTASATTSAGKVKECLFQMGLPILQGGLSTIVGILTLSFPPSYVFTTFSKTIFLVIIFGMMHSLLLLPVMLSILGPSSSLKKYEPKNYPHGIDDSNIMPNALKTDINISEQRIRKDFGSGTPSVSSCTEADSVPESMDVIFTRNQKSNITVRGNHNESFVYDDNDNIDVRL